MYGYWRLQKIHLEEELRYLSFDKLVLKSLKTL